MQQPTRCIITPAAIGPEYFRESAEVIEAAGVLVYTKTFLLPMRLPHGG